MTIERSASLVRLVRSDRPPLESALVRVPVCPPDRALDWVPPQGRALAQLPARVLAQLPARLPALALVLAFSVPVPVLAPAPVRLPARVLVLALLVPVPALAPDRVADQAR